MGNARVYSRKNKRLANRSGPSRNRRKRNLIKPFLFIAFVAVICYGVNWMLHAPAFMVTKAKVRGQHLLRPDVIWQDVHSVRGQNIFTLQTQSVRAKLLRHPEVADVRISRRFPNAVSVEIIERVPVAVLCSNQGLFLIDDSGRMLQRANRNNSMLPVVELPPFDPPALGKLIKVECIRGVLTCLGETRKNNTRVRKISVDQRGNMCLNMGSSFFVKLGQPIDISKKLSDLRSTIKARPDLAAKVLYFDMSCRERPVWKLKDGTVSSAFGEESEVPENSAGQ